MPVPPLDSLVQGSPTPGPWTGTGLRPVRNWAAQQEVSGGWVEASSAAPHRSPSLALPPEPSPCPPVHGEIGFHETGPGARKVGDCCFSGSYSSCLSIVPTSYRVRILEGQGDMPIQNFNTFQVTEIPDSWFKLRKPADEGGNGVCIGGWGLSLHLWAGVS